MSMFQTLFKGSRTRLKLMIVMLAVILVIIFGIYRYSQSSNIAGGASRLTGTPDVASVPGSQKLSPSYLQLLKKSNAQIAQQAIKMGTSAIPTVINTGQAPASGSQLSTTGSCQAFCNQWSDCGGCQSGGVSSKSLLSEMVASGDLSPLVAAQLTRLSDGCTTLDDYALALNKLVSQGKLKSSQAKQLQAAYQSKYDKLSPVQLVSQLVGAGEVQSDTAGTLGQMNSSGMSPKDYSSAVNKMVQDGKLASNLPKCLAANYSKSYKPLSANSLVDQMLASGQLSPNIAKQVKQLNAAGLSCDDYTTAINKLSQDQKVTPSQASQLTDSYCGKSAQATPSHDNVIQGMLSSGKLTPDAALQLQKLSEAKASAADYAAELNRLVKANEITPPTVADQLLQAYREQYGDYSILKTDTPLMAQIKENQQKAALAAQAKLLTQQIAAYQEKLKQQQTTSAASASTDAQDSQQSALQAQVTAQQQAIQNQAKSLFSSWDVAPQTYVALPQATSGTASAGGQAATQAGQKGSTATATSKTKSTLGPMIKAGTIMFAVLDTALNSDEPGPVMATMVSGKFKGAKLMGNLKLVPSGKRVMLTFTSMIRDDWPENVKISAVAINPDTARTAVASDVNNHYLMRFGSIFAANFLAGYGQAISQEGSTITTSSGTSTTTKPNLSGADKALAALGQVGTAMSQIAGKWMNTPPTVKVDAGVGLGILFLTDTQAPTFMESLTSDAK